MVTIRMTQTPLVPISNLGNKPIKFWMRNFHRHLYIVRSSITKHVNDIACSVWMEKANLNLLLFFRPNTDFALHYWNSHFKYSDLNLLQMISVQMIIRVCQWKVFEPPYMRLTLLSCPKVSKLSLSSFNCSEQQHVSSPNTSSHFLHLF